MEKIILLIEDNPDDEIEGYRLGANAYVRKPVEFAEFPTATWQVGLNWVMLNEAPPAGK
jgi:two-component system response regulator